MAALFVYPVKSCRGFSPTSWRILAQGLQYDREWIIVDAADRFITQRTVPRLALVGTLINGTALELTAPEMPALSLPLEREGAKREVVVWRDTVGAIDQGDETAEWLSAFLETPVRLVRFDPAGHRLCNPEFAATAGPALILRTPIPCSSLRKRRSSI